MPNDRDYLCTKWYTHKKKWWPFVSKISVCANAKLKENKVLDIL